MANKNFVGLRLNDNKDMDIIMDLERYENRTERIKEVYRIVIHGRLEKASEVYEECLEELKPIETLADLHKRSRFITWSPFPVSELQKSL
jgi:hypothetical protein